MASPLTAKARRNALIFALWLPAAALCGVFPVAHAQTGGAGPIRVQSNEVLVPVLVLDKKRLDQIHQMDPISFVTEAIAGNSRLLEDLAVRGLSADDFQVFEDGRKQFIERVTFESIGALSGKEMAGEEGRIHEDLLLRTMPRTVVNLPVWPGYLVAYARPPSPDGSCHQVAVKVSRPDSLVYVRPEYCNTSRAANDSLRGTRLGSQMEADLGSSKDGQLSLSVVAFPSLRGAAARYTDIFLTSPTKPRLLDDCTKFPKIGVLGIAYESSGAVAARFSGSIFTDLNFRGQSAPLLAPGVVRSCVLSGPNVYETRLDLRPGEYNLKVVIMDGKKFGRAETPVTVESPDASRLDISAIIISGIRREAPVGAEDDPATVVGGYVPLVSRGFEAIPAGDTRFRKGEPVGFYFEIYDPPGVAATTVNAHLRILNAKTGQVVRELKSVDAVPYAKPGDPVIPIGGGIDISGLPSGSYLLGVQAADSSGQSTAWHATSFAIE